MRRPLPNNRLIPRAFHSNAVDMAFRFQFGKRADSAFPAALILFALLAVVSMGATARAADEADTYAGRTAASWVAQLKAEDQSERRRAAYALGRIAPNDISVVQALVAALDDPYQPARRYVVHSLGRIGPPAESAIGAIVHAIGDDKNDDYFRYMAVQALGRIGKRSDNVSDVLHQALASGNLVYRVHASLALWKIHHDAESLDNLTALLNQDDPVVLFEAAMAIAELGPAAEPAAPRLVQLLAHHDSDVRRAAAATLVRIGQPALPLLVDTLQDASAGTDPRAVIYAVGRILDQIRGDVIEAPETTIETLRDAAGPLLTTVAPALVARFDAEDEALRFAAADAVARLGLLAVPLLARTIENPNERLSQTAVVAFERLEQHLPPAKTSALAPLRANLVAPLLAVMQSQDPTRRRAGFRAFQALELPTTAPETQLVLQRSLKDTDAGVRRYAKELLQE